jgi:hypothetical protein
LLMDLSSLWNQRITLLEGTWEAITQELQLETPIRQFVVVPGV